MSDSSEIERQVGGDEVGTVYPAGFLPLPDLPVINGMQTGIAARVGETLDDGQLAQIDHDLRNLQSLEKMCSGMARRERSKAKPDQDKIALYERQAAAAKGLVGHILIAIKSWNSLLVGRVDLTSLLHEFEVTQNLIYGKSLNFKPFEIQDGLGATINPHEFIRWLSNMITNSFQNKRGSEFQIRAFTQGEQIIIEVMDSGNGVEQSLTKKIFERGFSTKESSGFGLAEIANRVKTWGGDIKCDGNGGIEGGAKFIITLPCGHDPARNWGASPSNLEN